jgi:hypothetical protein
MRFFKLLTLMAFWSMTAFSMKAGADVKSYKEWKTERVTGTQTRINIIRNQIENRKAVRNALASQGTDPNLKNGRGTLEAASTGDYTVEKLERQLKVEQYNLELAQDLSVTDYFAGYLTKVQNKKSAFNEVAGKLSPEEVAELMNAYANAAFGAHASDLPVSAAVIEKSSAK